MTSPSPLIGCRMTDYVRPQRLRHISYRPCVHLQPRTLFSAHSRWECALEYFMPQPCLLLTKLQRTSETSQTNEPPKNVSYTGHYGQAAFWRNHGQLPSIVSDAPYTPTRSCAGHCASAEGKAATLQASVVRMSSYTSTRKITYPECVIQALKKSRTVHADWKEEGSG